MARRKEGTIPAKNIEGRHQQRSPGEGLYVASRLLADCLKERREKSAGNWGKKRRSPLLRQKGGGECFFIPFTGLTDDTPPHKGETST